MTVTINDLRKTYIDTQAKLESIDFEKLWPGFTAFPFALYNDEFVYFKDEEIPWDDRFRGNTSIEIDGEYVAIWNMNYLEYSWLDYLTYNLIHEMFHCFQYKQEERRFPNDLKLLKQPNSLKFYGMKIKENKILCQALNETGDERKELLYEYAGMHVKRREVFPEITFEEELAQSIEGAAEYVAMKALYQLSLERFNEQLKTYTDLLLDRHMIFNNHVLEFFKGAIICLFAEDSGINWDKTIRNQVHTNFDLIFPEVVAIDYEVEIPDRLKLKLKEHSEEIAASIEAVRNEGTEVILKERAVIKHYDPMNMNYYDDKIHSKNFVQLQIGNEIKTLDGETVLHLVPGSFDEVKSYTNIQ